MPKSKLKKDLIDVFETLSHSTHINELKIEDMKSALEAYSKELVHFTIDDISKSTDIKIEKNKSNYRKQSMHLKGARAIRDINNPNWRDGNGRKSKEEIVKEWRKSNPNGKKIDCYRDTKLSRVTIDKWW